MNTNLKFTKLAYGYNYLVDIFFPYYRHTVDDNPDDKAYLVTYHDHFINLDLSKFTKNKLMIDQIKLSDPMIQCNAWTNIENNQIINLIYIYRNPLNESGEYIYIRKV